MIRARRRSNVVKEGETMGLEPVELCNLVERRVAHANTARVKCDNVGW